MEYNSLSYSGARLFTIINYKFVGFHPFLKYFDLKAVFTAFILLKIQKLRNKYFITLIILTGEENLRLFCNKIFQKERKFSKKNIFAISINRKKRALV